MIRISAIFVGVALIVLQATPTLAQQSPPVGVNCSSYDGKVATFDNLTPLIDRMNLIEKGEYETSDAFAARRTSAIGSMKSVYVVKSTMELPKIQYDADNAQAIFFLENFGKNNGDGFGNYILDGFEESGKPHTLDYYTLARSKTILGSYLATNIFGAKVRITREVETRTHFIDRSNIETTTPWGIKYPPTEAAKLLPQMQAALVVSLDGEVFSKGTHTLTPDADFLISREVRSRYVSGNLHCGLLYLPGGMVVATFDPKRRFP